MEKIIALWQPVGYSTHLIAKRVAEKLNMKTSHTGTLDPMAEGVIIILAGEERRKKYDYSNWLKEYEFEMVFGIKTDTLDGLGIPSFGEIGFDEDALRDIVDEMIGPYKQKYPKFSAKKLLGKPLHWFARNNVLDQIEIPTKEGEILEFELFDVKDIGYTVIKNDVIGRIKSITGDLRQQEIIDAWESKDSTEVFKIAKLRVVMTKGLYVRGLVRDIADRLKVSAFTFSIKRTKNGSYGKEDSKTPQEFFGSAFDRKNFISRGES